MTEYRIAHLQTRIVTSNTGNGHWIRQPKSLVKDARTFWSGHFRPEPVVTIEFAQGLEAARALAEPNAFAPASPGSRVLKEHMALQQRRTPEFLGWKTLQMAEIAPPHHELIEEAQVVEQARPGLGKRILEFMMENDLLRNVAQR